MTELIYFYVYTMNIFSQLKGRKPKNIIRWRSTYSLSLLSWARNITSTKRRNSWRAALLTAFLAEFGLEIRISPTERIRVFVLEIHSIYAEYG